ncbi:MAG: AMP-binding protein [Alphaproteobacteria bacterium]|nr:AMP-binding protein [Alphaproteobacteria bacterium]
MPDGLLHPEFESLIPAARLAVQRSLWPAQWDHVRRHSVFYGRKLAGRMPATLALDALESLPFTDKDELRDSQAADSPFGDYIACPPGAVVRLHRTSGTTGRALQLANTAADVAWIARIGGRALYASGLRPGDRVVHCLNYCLWTGGVTDHVALEATGACVVPFGVGNTRELIAAIVELGVTAISCTPSYPALIEKVLREDGARAPRELGLRLALFGGEAGLDNPEFRARLADTWGFAPRNANYGMSEVLSNFGSQCEHTGDLHFHADDFLHAEIVDATGTPLPIREGAVGELVCTHLRKQCQPLLRYRTRDIVTVTGTGPCACGRTAWRFRVTGRADDMFVVRGVNVFPTAVQSALAQHPAIASGQFRIVLAGPGPYDRIDLRVEAAAALPEARWPDAAKALEAGVRRVTGAGAVVTMLAPETLPRTAGKTSWIERRPA